MIKNILVIEDDRFIGEMYVRSLQMANYAVDWVVDGNDGLVMARNKVYDLILVDIMIPEKRGGEIISELKNSDSISRKIISWKCLMATLSNPKLRLENFWR